MRNNKNTNDKNELKNMYPQGIYICPVCNKEFKADDNTRFIISGGYTCSLKCFLNEIKRRESMKEKTNKENKKTKNK